VLRQLMLTKKITGLRESLAALREEESALQTRSEELEKAIEEASTDEELQAVEESINGLEAEKAKLKEKKSNLESEIAELEGELEELKSKEPPVSGGAKQRSGDQVKDREREELRAAIAAFVRSKGKVIRSGEGEGDSGFKVVDGGALVPEDLLPAEETPEDVVDLKKYVRVVPVNRGSGTYPIISKSGSRMNTVEELEENPELQKPKVTDTSYKIETYRGYIPVSQEVIDDADYDIVGLIGEEINDQKRNTTNYAIAQILKGATAKTVNGLDGLITLLNTGFKTAYDVKLFVSQSLFNELDLMKDKRGRYLLQDDITVASGKRLKGKEIVILDDEMIGESPGDLVGFIGDARAFVRFFDRKQLSVKWVDHSVYGEMLAGFLRFDVIEADSEAGYYITFVPDDGNGEDNGGEEV